MNRFVTTIPDECKEVHPILARMEAHGISHEMMIQSTPLIKISGNRGYLRLARHVHAQPYIKSQRNDRQSEYDRDKAPQDAPVNMIYDVNGEELMIIANKRLCKQASAKTRKVVRMMCDEVAKTNPEFTEFLVPMCQYVGECKEMNPCGGESNE